MTYEEFLDRIINDGIAAAKADYKRPAQKAQLEGSIAGFEACREKGPSDLALLLGKAQANTHTAFRRVNEREISDEEYWKIRCFEAEVEWTCNCVSALTLSGSPWPPIVTPTARGVMKAAEIVGVKGAKEEETHE